MFDPARWSLGSGCPASAPPVWQPPQSMMVARYSPRGSWRCLGCCCWADAEAAAKPRVNAQTARARAARGLMGYGLLGDRAAHGAATTRDRKRNEAGRHRRGDLDGKALARAWMYGPACVAEGAGDGDE